MNPEVHSNSVNDQDHRKDTGTKSNGRGPSLLITAAVITLIAALVIGVLPRLRQKEALADGVKEIRGAVMEVTVVKPRRVSDPGVVLPGNIQAIRSTAINARTTGYLTQLNVDIGTHVKAGQVLAVIQSPDVDQQAVQADAQTAQSRAAVEQSRASVAQQQAIVAQDRAEVSRQRFVLQQARQSIIAAEAQYAQAVATEKGANSGLAHSRQALVSQQAAYRGAQAQLNLAKVTNDRYQNLLKQQFVAKQDADQAEATYKVDVAALESAKAAVDAAAADVQTAVQTVSSAKSSVVSAQANLDSSKESVEAAQASLESAEAAVRAALQAVTANSATVRANTAAVAGNVANGKRMGVMVGFEKIVAPFDGVITARNVDVGTLISAGGTETGVTAAAPNSGMLGLAKTDVVRIQVNVPQTYVPSFGEGCTTSIAVRELPGKLFAGSVAIRAGALDTTTRTQLVEVHVDNPKGELVPGMYAEVTLIPMHPAKSIRIPGTALIVDSTGTHVAVVKKDLTIHMQKVVVGRDFGQQVEILKGLKGRESLVNNPLDTLQDGAKVQVQAKPAGADKAAGGAAGAPAGGAPGAPGADGKPTGAAGGATRGVRGGNADDALEEKLPAGATADHPELAAPAGEGGVPGGGKRRGTGDGAGTSTGAGSAESGGAPPRTGKPGTTDGDDADGTSHTRGGARRPSKDDTGG